MDKLKQYKLKRGLGVFLVVMSSTLLILFAAVGFLFGINRFALSIQLSGEPDMELEYGEIFKDPGTEVRLVGSMV